MTVLNSPLLASDAESSIGYAYRYLPGMIRQALAERFDVAAGGLVARIGDVAGSGSDTVRTRRVTGLGWSKTMASLGSETEAIAASPLTVGTDDITIGRHGLAFSESFQHAIQDDAMLRVDDIAGSFVDSYLATLRSLVCTTGATFSTNSADAAATLDVNDWIALRGDFEASAGFDGRAVSILHPEQITHLRNSIRSETALQYPESFELYQRMQAEAGFRFTFLGIDIYGSSDVSLSGGDYYGFAYSPGALAYAVGSTAQMGDLSDSAPVFVPEWGIVVTRKTDGQSATKRIDANAFVGVGKLSAELFPQFLIRSNAT
jgi:hypothetical protein